MTRQEKFKRVKKIRELLGCGVLEARKYEAYLWERQIEIDIDSLRHLQWGNPKSQLVTTVRKEKCYECDAEVYELSPRVRCVMCEHRRANSAVSERDALRAEIEKIKAQRDILIDLLAN